MLPTVEEIRSCSSVSCETLAGVGTSGTGTTTLPTLPLSATASASAVPLGAAPAGFTTSTATLAPPNQGLWRSSSLRTPTPGQISRSSVSTLEFGERKPGEVNITQKWTSLEMAGRCMFTLSVAFLIGGVLMTIFGFTDINVIEQARLPLQIIGPVCLATTAVMWMLGAVFSKLWKIEWASRQQALELKAQVQLHAMAMDILNERVMSPSHIVQDSRLRRQLMLKLRQQNVMETSSVVDNASRRSSNVFSTLDNKRRRGSSVSALLRQELDRRQSKDHTNMLPHFELPGIQISRIETVDYEDGPGIPGSAGLGNTPGSKRYIIFHSDLSSDFSQLSFTSEDFLSGSRSSRSRSSRASSNISSRLWDFSPRESEWDADISQGSRDSKLSQQDWGGGPSYGMHRELSLLSPSMRRKGSVVTFDGEGPTRRHSSPTTGIPRRKSYTCDGTRSDLLPSMRYREHSSGGLTRHIDDYRTLNMFRKRSTEDQSIISVPIDENDGDEDCYDEDNYLRGTQLTMTREEDELGLEEQAGETTGEDLTVSSDAATTTADMTEIMILAMRRASPKRNTTDDSEVESRVAQILHEIDFSATDSVDESKILLTMSSADQSSPRMDAQTQTLTLAELQRLQQTGPFILASPRRFRFVQSFRSHARERFGQAIRGGWGFRKTSSVGAIDSPKSAEQPAVPRTQTSEVTSNEKSTETTESTPNSYSSDTTGNRERWSREREDQYKEEKKKSYWFSYIPSAWSPLPRRTIRADTVGYAVEPGSSKGFKYSV